MPRHALRWMLRPGGGAAEGFLLALFRTCTVHRAELTVDGAPAEIPSYPVAGGCTFKAALRRGLFFAHRFPHLNCEKASRGTASRMACMSRWDRSLSTSATTRARQGTDNPSRIR